MKKTFVLAGFMASLLACNNNSSNTKTGSDTSHHGHNGTVDNNKKETGMNEIHESMKNMMHNMHNARPTGNNDVDFATMMVDHHKGAVEMSKVEIAKGANDELKAFAQKVIDDQNKEIAFMEEFISKAAKSASPNSADFQKAMNQSMMAMMDDSTPIYNDIDKDFAAQMIPHHQSAVDMAKAYLEQGQDASLKKLCQDIISSQTSEIKWLKEWLGRHGKDF